MSKIKIVGQLRDAVVDDPSYGKCLRLSLSVEDVEQAADTIEHLAKKAKALVDAVTVDDSGQLIGTVWVGGNGGLISKETIVAADELRKELADIEGKK